MARRGELQLILTATRGPDERWRGGRGRITLTQLEVLLDHPATMCFVCGPAAMVDDVPRMLRQLGVENGADPDRGMVSVGWPISRVDFTSTTPLIVLASWIAFCSASFVGTRPESVTTPLKVSTSILWV